jgi:hypothetical protein
MWWAGAIGFWIAASAILTPIVGRILAAEGEYDFFYGRFDGDAVSPPMGPNSAR